MIVEPEGLKTSFGCYNYHRLMIPYSAWCGKELMVGDETTYPFCCNDTDYCNENITHNLTAPEVSSFVTPIPTTTTTATTGKDRLGF